MKKYKSEDAIQEDAILYLDAQELVITAISEKLEVSNSEAFDLFEYNEFYFDQAWCMGLQGQALIDHMLTKMKI